MRLLLILHIYNTWITEVIKRVNNPLSQEMDLWLYSKCSIYPTQVRAKLDTASVFWIHVSGPVIPLKNDNILFYFKEFCRWQKWCYCVQCLTGNDAHIRSKFPVEKSSLKTLTWLLMIYSIIPSWGIRVYFLKYEKGRVFILHYIHDIYLFLYLFYIYFT